MGKTSLILLLASSSLWATSCSPSPNSPKEVAKQFVVAIQQDNLNKAAQFTSDPKIVNLGIHTDIDKAESKALFSKIRFHINSSVANGTKATVSIKVTAPDIFPLYFDNMDVAAADMSGSKAKQDKLIKKVQNDIKKLPDYTITVPLHMVKQKDGWKVAPNNKLFMEAILGERPPGSKTVS